MEQHIKEKLLLHTKKNQGKPVNYRAEALFYCSENNYDYRQARQAFDEDLKYEDEMSKRNKKGSLFKWINQYTS